MNISITRSFEILCVTVKNHPRRNFDVRMFETRSSDAAKKIWRQVLPGFEPGLLDSKSRVITNYTIEPVLLQAKKCRIPDGIRTRNLKIRSLTPYPLGHGDIFMRQCYDRFFFGARVYVHTQNFLMRPT